MTMLDKVRTDRMRVLADFLVSDEVGEFDLRNWQTRAFVPGRKFGPFVAREECGFAGCAIGWAIHKRLFEGLRFAPGRLEFRGPDIRLNGYAGWDAINELFGLPKRGLRAPATSPPVFAGPPTSSTPAGLGLASRSP